MDHTQTDKVEAVDEPCTQAATQPAEGVPDPKRPGFKRGRVSHRYRGHRAASFTAEDVNELIEIRARQRTFDGAYARTAMGTLGYAVAVLRLFDRQFYHIGLLYTILAGLLFVISCFRERSSLHDFADKYLPFPNHLSPAHGDSDRVIKTVGQTGKRNFGRPFRTAGWVVLAVSGIVGVVDLALIVLIVKLDTSSSNS